MGSTDCVQKRPGRLQDLFILLGLLLIHPVVLWPSLQGQAFAQPRIDSIGPNPGIIGEQVTILGQGFDRSSPSKNIINYGRLSIPAETVDAAGTRLTVTFSKAPVTGPITISSVTPSIPPVEGGGVVITGQNFPGAPMPLTVTVGALSSNAVNFSLSGITRVLVDVLTQYDSLLFSNLGNAARFPFTANVTSPTSMSVTIPPLLSLAPPPGPDLYLPGGIRAGFRDLLIKFFDGSLSNTAFFSFPQLAVVDPGLFTPEAPIIRLPPAPIQCRQTIPMAISQREIHRFEFQGRQDEVVTVAMHGIGGLDPEIILFGPGPLSEFLPPPRLLTGDDDSGPGLDALLRNVRLPASGIYTIEARSSASTGFRTTGSYLLTLTCGLETEFVDPVPDLLAGPAVTTKEEDLAKMGTVVTGIAADGAAQVVVRVKTGQAGTVEFSLVNRKEGGTLVPADNFNGSLSQVGQGTGSSTVSVDTKNIDGVGPMAFAAYHAPIDFARNPPSSEAGKKEREAFIRIRLRTSTGETVESTEFIKIVRPPVLLVHGIWSEADAWDNFAPLINDPKFFKRRVQYKKTNPAHFSVNAPIVLRQLKPFIDEYKAAERVAAVRADVVNHSMGGLMARMLPLFEDAYFRDDNFNLGDVHKVINFGTPNFGTRFAQFLLRSPCVQRFFKKYKKPADQGAVEDLIPASPALNEINNTTSPLQLHQIVALATDFNKIESEASIGFRHLRRQCPEDFRGFPRRGFFDTVLLTPDHDLLVPALSQRGRATRNSTPFIRLVHSRVPFLLIGTGEIESSEISGRIIELLNTALSQPEFDTFR